MDESLQDWLTRLGSKTPTPGGGAVAALSAAVAAAQLAMVANYTTAEKFADVSGQMKEFVDELAELQQNALDLVAADATAFSKIGAAYMLPKKTVEQEAKRAIAIQAALTAAAQPPCLVVAVAEQLVIIAEELERSGNKNVISDVAVGASTARAALESAIVNIEINKTSIKDESIQKELAAKISDAEDVIKKADAVTQKVRKRFA